jgi:hypothetical protein
MVRPSGIVRCAVPRPLRMIWRLEERRRASCGPIEARLGPAARAILRREDEVDAVVARAQVEHVGRRLGAGDRRSSGVEAELPSASHGCARNYCGPRKRPLRYGPAPPTRSGRARHNPGRAHSWCASTPDGPRRRRAAAGLQSDRVPAGGAGADPGAEGVVGSGPYPRDRAATATEAAVQVMAGRRFMSQPCFVPFPTVPSRGPAPATSARYARR